MTRKAGVQPTRSSARPGDVGLASLTGARRPSGIAWLPPRLTRSGYGGRTPADLNGSTSRVVAPSRAGASATSSAGQGRTRGYRGAAQPASTPGKARSRDGAVARSEGGHGGSGSPRGRRPARSY